jgi:glycine betaine/proline transport system ATP-binding protein
MERPSVQVQEEQDLETVSNNMKDREVEVAFVTDTTGRLKGVVTLKQVEASLEKGLKKVEEAAQTEFPHASSDTPLTECLPLIADGEIPLVILDDSNHLLGVVSRSALIAAMQSDNGDNNKK